MKKFVMEIGLVSLIFLLALSVSVFAQPCSDIVLKTAPPNPLSGGRVWATIEPPMPGSWGNYANASLAIPVELETTYPLLVDLSALTDFHTWELNVLDEGHHLVEVALENPVDGTCELNTTIHTVKPPNLVMEVSDVSSVKGNIPFDVNVTLNNTGEGDAHDVKIEPVVPANVVIDGDHSYEIASIAGGETITKTFTFRSLETGNPAFDLVVKYSDVYDGPYRASSVLQFNTSGEKLVINSVSVKPSTITRGNPTTLSAVVQNNGTTGLANFSVTFYLDEVSDAGKIEEILVTEVLDPGNETTVTTTWTPTSASDHQIYAVVGTDNGVYSYAAGSGNSGVTVNLPPAPAAPAPSGGGGGGGGYRLCSSSDYDCTDWSDCSESGDQTRTCAKISGILCTPYSDGREKPPELQTCTYVPPTPACTLADYDCSVWSECSESGEQTRTCAKKVNCEGGESPDTLQSCEYTSPAPTTTGGPPTGLFTDPATLGGIVLLVLIILGAGIYKYKKRASGDRFKITVKRKV